MPHRNTVQVQSECPTSSAPSLIPSFWQLPVVSVAVMRRLRLALAIKSIINGSRRRHYSSTSIFDSNICVVIEELKTQGSRCWGIWASWCIALASRMYTIFRLNTFFNMPDLLPCWSFASWSVWCVETKLSYRWVLAYGVQMSWWSCWSMTMDRPLPPTRLRSALFVNDSM